MHKRLEWIEWYHELEKYYAEHGNIDVPARYETKEGLKLGMWINTQRNAYNGKGAAKITKDHIKLLNNLGMKWNIYMESWNAYYNKLKDYYEEHGNIDVPYRYKTKEGLRLGAWINVQRNAYNGKGTARITDDHIELLNNLGMRWDFYMENWTACYYELEKYRDKYGNVNVSKDYVTQDGFKLGLWLKNQRQAYKGNSDYKITQDHIKILNNLNIDWALRDTKLLNMKITRENSDKYYRALNDRLNHVLADISYEDSNEITKDNQGELCKQIIKRIWR